MNWMLVSRLHQCFSTWLLVQYFFIFLMKQTLMLLLYVHIYSMQCGLEEGEGCVEGCSVSKRFYLLNNLFVRFSESWYCYSLLNPTKSPFYDVIILVFEILVSSKEYALCKVLELIATRAFQRVICLVLRNFRGRSAYHEHLISVNIKFACYKNIHYSHLIFTVALRIVHS